MAMLPAPLVYVGPTLSAQEVRGALPDCILRPPVARGDLYRDRLLRGSVFVILDGVFFQHRALSPREILDVVGDGGLVIGASSLGALRAAECWPAGMRGIGAIYRLLRAGALTSDDEVAVAYDPDDPSGRSSVALVNVRHAVWRALREGRLDAELAARVVAAAQALFYSERHWPRILKDAGVRDPDGVFAQALGRHDLKRLDGLRALARVQRWRARDAEFCVRPRRSAAPFVPSEAEREREHDALDGRSVDEALPELARCLVASGRYLRYARARPEGPPFLSVFLQQQEAAAKQLLAWVSLSGELDAELFRARALRRLAAHATALGVVPTTLLLHQATEQMLIEHQCESWQELMQIRGGNPNAEPLFGAHRELLARAIAVRNR